MRGRPLLCGLVAASLALCLLPTRAFAAPFAYVANGNGFVSVIDLATETEVASISTTGGDPYWVNISANGAVVAVSLHNRTGVALIDGTTNTLIGVVGGVGSEPEAVAVNSDGSTVYVGDESGGDLYVVDVTSRTVTGSPIDVVSGSCSEPENMVISPDDAFLYVTCAGSSVIRVATVGFAITTIATGLSDPHGIALNTAGTRLYYTDGTNALEYNTVTGALTGTTYAGCDMYGGAVSPDGTRLYCVEEGSSLKIYDTAAGGAPLATVALDGNFAAAVAVHPDNSRVYVPVTGLARALDVIDAATMTDLPGNVPISGGQFPAPRGIAIGPGPALPTPAPLLHNWALAVVIGLLLWLGVFSTWRRKVT